VAVKDDYESVVLVLKADQKKLMFKQEFKKVKDVEEVIAVSLSPVMLKDEMKASLPLRGYF
jgi:nitrate reductase NapAB chaperone NapD